ncbi:hypothetical protein ON010_g97 [Phytophthora cinnamomi]|nr:hypothetical protein ON010_g97 [Phytophthora cinnamomi]
MVSRIRAPVSNVRHIKRFGAILFQQDCSYSRGSDRTGKGLAAFHVRDQEAPASAGTFTIRYPITSIPPPEEANQRQVYSPFKPLFNCTAVVIQLQLRRNVLVQHSLQIRRHGTAWQHTLPSAATLGYSTNVQCCSTSVAVVDGEVAVGGLLQEAINDADRVLHGLPVLGILHTPRHDSTRSAEHGSSAHQPRRRGAVRGHGHDGGGRVYDGILPLPAPAGVRGRQHPHDAPGALGRVQPQVGALRHGHLRLGAAGRQGPVRRARHGRALRAAKEEARGAAPPDARGPAPQETTRVQRVGRRKTTERSTNSPSLGSKVACIQHVLEAIIVSHNAASLWVQRASATFTSGHGPGGRRREATLLAALVHGVGDPVDARVATDDLVRVVHHDDLEVLVRGVLVDPVRVEHAQVRELVAGALLGHRAQVALELELVDTVVLGLTVHDTLRVRALAATATHGDAHDHVALLGLVAEAASLETTAEGAPSMAPMFSDDMVKSTLFFLLSPSCTGVEANAAGAAATVPATAAAAAAPAPAPASAAPPLATAMTTSTTSFLASLLASSSTGGVTATPFARGNNPLFSDQATDGDDDSIWNILVSSSVDRVRSAIGGVQSPQEKLRLILEEREKLEEQRKKVGAPAGPIMPRVPAHNAEQASAAMENSRQHKQQNPLFSTEPALETRSGGQREPAEDDLWKLLMSSSIDSFRRVSDLGL